MTKKAQNYIARRQAALLGQHLTGERRTFEKSRRGIAPRMMGVSLYGDRVGAVATGHLKVETREVTPSGLVGPWRVHEDHKNLVVTQAERLMANAMAGTLNSAFSYIELGDPTYPATSPQLDDVNLEQTTGERKAVSVTVASNVLTAECTFLAGDANGFTFTEAGLFTGPFGAGTMFARKTFNEIIKTIAFEMRFTWIITFLVNPAGSGDCTGVALVGPATIVNETIYESLTGGEASVAATFDFTVGAGHLEVVINGQRMVRSRQYVEASPALAAPIGGPALNKGINLVGFTLNPGDVAYLVQRTIN